MEKSPVFFADGSSTKMINAYKKAQETFKYFWREQSWEYRRIVPGLTVSCVKVAFTQEKPGSSELMVEHMWINEIDFDGDHIRGVLINQPNDITHIQVGDPVEVPLEEISDWLFAIYPSKQPKGLSKLFSSSPLPKAYGGFTIQVMREEMSKSDRKAHDNAWGLDFGDYNDIQVVNEQKLHPENLIEHPMSKNMKEKLIEFIQQYPSELTHTDEKGYTILHKETIAGNLTSVDVLLKAGADKNVKTQSGKTALDFARQMKWEHIIPMLESN